MEFQRQITTPQEADAVIARADNPFMTCTVDGITWRNNNSDDDGVFESKWPARPGATSKRMRNFFVP
jgi:hypothetical protein